MQESAEGNAVLLTSVDLAVAASVVLSRGNTAQAIPSKDELVIKDDECLIKHDECLIKHDEFSVVVVAEEEDGGEWRAVNTLLKMMSFEF